MFYIFEAMSFKYFIAYLKYILTANNRHGTHSPFVYKLADEVIYDFSSKKVYEAVEAIRKKLLNDHSNAANLPKNKIKKTRIEQLIFRLAAYHTPKNVLVLGSNLGIATAYLANACPDANLTVIEDCATKASIANQVFNDLKLNNIELIVGNFNVFLPKVVAEVATLDFVYLNGTHTKTSILNYFNLCLPKLTEYSLLIIDGINSSEDRSAAWAEIKNHPQVAVTIDLFWLGLVYFKKGQAKEHFKLQF